MNITDFLIYNALHYADDAAITDVSFSEDLNGKQYNELEKKTLTWKQFNDKANRVSYMLKKLGVEKNSKVAILLPNCIEWLPIYFGILKLDAIAVPLNYRYDTNELKYCLEFVRCAVVITSADFDERIRGVRNALSELPFFIFIDEIECVPQYGKSFIELMQSAKEDEPNVPIAKEDGAAIYFTSGTTGIPKAILISHESLLHACYTERENHFQTKNDRFLCIPPLYHTGAKMHWFGSLISGSSMVLLRSVSPRYILETVSKEKITIVWLLVPWAQDILASLECGDVNINDYDCSSWRLTHIGAQPVPPVMVRKWLDVFPDQSYDTNYGLSEATGPGCVHLGVENIHKVGSIGKASYGWETNILNQNGDKVEQGEIGELVVKGPGVMVGYYNDPEATEKVLKNGWLFTGDMAYEDEDGFIYLVDRKKDIIITSGENISAIQIEDYIYKHPAVKDVAVIGLKQEREGEMVAAVIELKPDTKCTKSEMFKFCEELPDYKRPRKFIFAPIPRNSIGKIDKVKLRELYS